MSFDPQSFLDASITGALDTKIIPCPAGEYQAFITKIAPRQWQSKDGTQTGIALDVFWSIEDEGIKAQLDRKEVIVKQGLMLDMLPDGSALDVSSGKNVGLGRLREAVGKNSPGEVFSFQMLPGLGAKVSVTHRVSGEDTFAEVRGVAKL